MKIHIVCYDDIHAWIIGKFAIKLNENLQKLRIQSDISDKPDLNSDINHHLIFNQYDGKKSTIDTIMITHIDNLSKLNMLEKQMETVRAGICMSRETMIYLAKMGIEKSKLCYVNPAHDGILPVKKIIIGIASRIYDDGRKNEHYLNKLAKTLNPIYFKFKIFGSGWESQIECLEKHGFEVEYTDHFDYEKYLHFIPSLDYYLYMGTDEGQMGFVDALSSGVKTIVVPQGYHLDAYKGITHSFTTYDELENILLQLQKDKETLISSVATWNWLDYTKKHVEIWQYLLNNRKTKSVYIDGLNSIWESEAYDYNFKQKESLKLNKNNKKRRYNQIRYIIGKLVKNNGQSGFIHNLIKRISNLLKKKIIREKS